MTSLPNNPENRVTELRNRAARISEQILVNERSAETLGAKGYNARFQVTR